MDMTRCQPLPTGFRLMALPRLVAYPRAVFVLLTHTLPGMEARRVLPEAQLGSLASVVSLVSLSFNHAFLNVYTVPHERNNSR